MKTKFKDLSREEAIRIIVDEWNLDVNSDYMQVLSVLIPELREKLKEKEKDVLKDIKYILANADLSKVKTSFYDMISYLNSIAAEDVTDDVCKEKENEPTTETDISIITEVFGFKIGDKVRLNTDQDKKIYTIKAIKLVDVGQSSYYVVFFKELEHVFPGFIIPGMGYPNGFVSNMVKTEK